ncbi:unnamed protein product [Orchesella dallaii]|uniref:Uncharacterized protein n=1 Tax=Orchesella dallaii TaxID=48710 RepID=A0ABP1Q4Z9_9HEXA
MMAILPPTFILFLIQIHFIGPAFSELKPLPGRVISGLYYDETTRFIPYTKVVPIAFEFKLPPFWRSSTAFQILPRLTCRSDLSYPVLSTADWYFTCPIFYHLHQLLQIFKTNYTDIYPTSQTLSASLYGPLQNQKFSNPHIRFDDCDSILEKMWKGVTSRGTGFTDYKGIVEKCSSMPSYFEEGIQDSATDFNGYFDRMQSNFVTTFFLNSSDPGELINNLLGLQGIQLQSIYAELTSFREALLSCRNQLIPESLVKSSRLEQTLLDLRPKLLKMRYAVSTQSIGKLYKIPIADCVFSPSSLIVQILLPVVRADASFTLLNVHSPFFLYGNRLCKVFPGPGESMSSSEDIISDDEPLSKYYLFEKNSKTIVKTSCTPGDLSLCHIPDQADRPIVNRCLYSVLSGPSNTEDIRVYCRLQCEKRPLSDSLSKLVIPVIQRISTNKFVIAVNRITTLLIKCEGKADEMVTPQEYGAIEISLACGCYLMWHSEKFEARVPCINTVSIFHVVPEHMLNRSAVLTANKFFLMSNLGERINTSLITSDDNDKKLGVSMGIMELATTTATPDNENINDVFNSVDVVNQSTFSIPSKFSFDGDCYTSVTHTFLWIAVGIESTLFLVICLYLYCRIYEMDKKWDLTRERMTVSYSSAAQLTNMYE